MLVTDLKKYFEYSGDYAVCIKDGKHIMFSVLKTDVLLMYQKLVALTEQRVILAVNDTVNFIRGFMALVLAGKEILLPANNQPGTLTSGINNPQAIVCDFDFKSDLLTFFIEQLREQSSESGVPLNSIVSDDSIIELCTSGSTGEPKQIRKNFKTLTDELTCLDALWEDKINDSIFVSTVSHQHIYGLLFRVLWPLLTRRLFHADNIEYPEQIIKIAQKQVNLTLISSPAYLKRMIEILDKKQLKNRLKIIFSSGGPLPQEIALAYEQKLGLSPMEILGSTETGGVAFRRQIAGSENLWEKFPPVSVRSNTSTNALEIKSPFCFMSDWFSMGDKAEVVSENQFRLMGRLDRIVKLEEKRISLDNMEKVLEQAVDIQQAKIIEIPGKRTVLGVVAILSSDGKEKLRKMGRKSFADNLKQHLSLYFERVTLPRKWRYVADFPYNAQGKLTQQALLALFSGDA